MKNNSIRGFAVAVWQVAAVYIYFLLFDQFGFLHHVQHQGLSAQELQMVMAAMGCGGLASSFVFARLLRKHSLRKLLIGAWAGCALAAACSLIFNGLFLLTIEGGLIGLSTGAITVLVASVLRELVPSRRLGLSVGLGTGLAYGISNIPFLFDGGLVIIVAFSIILSLSAAGMSHLCLRDPDDGFAPAATKERVPLWPWVLGLGLLVCLDAGAFAMLQQDETLKAWTWGPSEHKMWLALVHFSAAVFAGILLDRGLRFSMVVTTWILFALAFSIIPQGLPDAFSAALLYASGISFYSVLLVAMPSYLATDLKGRAKQAAWLFGISGWVGSALGVGMAQENIWVPSGFLWTCGLGVLICLWALRGAVVKGALRVFGRSLFVLALCGLWLNYVRKDGGSASESTAVQRGAEVYRQEGCINCHSQYIRPGVFDESMWGPYSPIDRTEKPPMVGNRRQGPDLKNIGLRRSVEWHRLHLMHPRSVNPHSRMPAYTHLFVDGDLRGDDLIAYLMTRGEGLQDEYAKRFVEWSPKYETGSVERGAHLFSQHCVLCHGDSARGDGPTGLLMNPAPRDITAGPYVYAKPGVAGDPLTLALSRIIKYGLPGTSMPGHEVLSDQDVIDMVYFIASLKEQKSP